MRQRADWVSWIMQFIVGMVAGAFLGMVPCMMLLRYTSRSPITPDNAFHIMCATSLAIARLAAYKGDRLWFGKPSIFIPMGHKHSPFSKALALFFACVGFALVGVLVASVASRPVEPRPNNLTSESVSATHSPPL